jgi:hypothetical protein
MNTQIYAKNIVSYKANDICSAVKTNKSIRVGVYNGIKKKSFFLDDPADSCSNLSVYTKKKSEINKGETFVRYGRVTSTNKIYIDDVLVKDAKKTGDYSYFFISNKKKGTTESSMSTLNPAEKIFFTVDLSNKKMTNKSYKDLRLSLVYGYYEDVDMNIGGYNSMIYYVFTNKGGHGPYSISDFEYDNLLIEETESGSKHRLLTYKIISSNLMTNVPDGETIKYIKVYPYYNYTGNFGSFRLFSLSVDGYEKYNSGKTYVSVKNAESIIRHNIVNNMLEEATVKWNVGGTTSIHFYHHYTENPIDMVPNSKTNYYGIPYVNTIE